MNKQLQSPLCERELAVPEEFGHTIYCPFSGDRMISVDQKSMNERSNSLKRNSSVDDY